MVIIIRCTKRAVNVFGPARLTKIKMPKGDEVAAAVQQGFIVLQYNRVSSCRRRKTIA
jgi:hypothetical protein